MSEFNPFEPGQAQTAWPLLEELRAEGPVATIAGGMRYVTRHAECRAALRDTEGASRTPSGMKAPGVDVPFEDRILGELDPPQHTAVRRVMVTALTPKVVHAAEHFMRDAADAAAAPGPGAGHGRPRERVHRAAPEPRHRAPARASRPRTPLTSPAGRRG